MKYIITGIIGVMIVAGALIYKNKEPSAIVGAVTPCSVNQGCTGSTTLTGILKGNGTGGVQTAVAGTDYSITGGGNTFGQSWEVAGNNSWLSPTTTKGIIVTASSTIAGLTVSNATSTGYFAADHFQSINSAPGVITLYNGSTIETLFQASGDSYSLGGNFGIGTSSPQGNFSVQGDSAGSATKGTCFRAKDVGAATFTYWWYKGGVATVQTASCSGTGTTTVTFD